MLVEYPTRTTLRNTNAFAHSMDTGATTFGVQKPPFAASWRIILSSVRSDTALRSREFSFSSSLSRCI
jgi:hypothetical protein